MPLFKFFWRGIGEKTVVGTATGTAAGTSTASATGASLFDGVGSGAGTSTASAVGSTLDALTGRIRRRGRYITPARWVVKEAYEEIRAQSAIREELRAIVGPYLLAGNMPAKAAPQTKSIDWEGMQNDSEAIYRLVVLWEEIIDEEETILLLGDL